MNGNIAVIYEQGVLKPLQPLNYPEYSQLEITIISPESEEVAKEFQIADVAQ